MSLHKGYARNAVAWVRQQRGTSDAEGAWEAMVQHSPYPERRSPALTPPTPADLFRLLWDELTDILGSAAAAILLRRSHMAAGALTIGSNKPRASGGDAEQLSIKRDGLEYRYTVPTEWGGQSAAAMTELRELVDQLRPLLVALTGEVILRRLDAQPDFKRCGISFATPPAQSETGGRP